jgi:hypothetical protein
MKDWKRATRLHHTPMKRLTTLLAPLPFVIAACTSSPPPDPLFDGLVGSQQMELFALHPDSREPTGQTPSAYAFHGYTVLGRAEVLDMPERDTLVGLVHRSVAASDRTVALCFDPRHGLRITKDGHTTDLVICFECFKMDVFVDGVRERERRLIAATFAADVTAHFTAHGLALHTDD